MSSYKQDDLEEAAVAFMCVGVDMQGFGFVETPLPGVCATTLARIITDVLWTICCSMATGFNMLALFTSTIAGGTNVVAQRHKRGGTNVGGGTNVVAQVAHT